VVYFVPTLWKRIIVLTAARTNCKDIRETYKVYKQFYENVDMIPCRRNRDFPALEMWVRQNRKESSSCVPLKIFHSNPQVL